MAVQSQTRRHSTCHRHPTTPVTGFCASCLRERLAGIEASAAAGGSGPIGSELRRSKSCSGGPRSEDAPADSQRRRSCDVRGRSGVSGNTSLWALFNLDDERKGAPRKFEEELGKLGFELKEEDEIRVNAARNEVEDEDDDVDGEAELKTMKEFIDLEWTRKKSGTGRDLRDIAGTFWEAASGLSKKLTRWKRKAKAKRLGAGENGGVSAAGNEEGRRLRETQSEVGEYGLGGGRRSCDTDPRFSVDVAARMSLDECRRCSFDEPRASWDGYLLGRAARMAPMVSVVEDGKLSDGCGSEGEDNAGVSGPGGTEQTKDYYSESVSRRRRSFECPNSVAARKAGVLAEVDDLKLISNAKVSPATTELFYGAKLLITDRDLRDAKLKAVKDDSVVLESASAKDAATATARISPSVMGQKGSKKSLMAPSQGWQRVWNIWGAKPRRSEQKCDGDDGLIVGPNTDTDSWKNGGSVSQCQKLIRSYSVSCQNQNKAASVESRANVLKSREEFLLQRNRSVRYSPSNAAAATADNGLLRFYLTPLRSYRRTQPGKSRLKTVMMPKNVL